ncbi:hypothetical protein bcere0017_21030 [Bacillus cereus Rock1-3]|nr:hypothetical protein bcere0017_21030 [Bacillus cereus Rock1-3]
MFDGIIWFISIFCFKKKCKEVCPFFEKYENYFQKIVLLHQ